MTRTMRTITRILLALALLVPVVATVQAADRIKPFVLAYKGPGDMAQKIQQVKDELTGAGFKIVGDYVPFDNAHVIIFTSPDVLKVAAETKLGGFAAPQRVSVDKVGDEIQVSYVNPIYMANAYQLKSDFSDLAKKLASTLGDLQTFGAEDGLTARKLRHYHYTFGMEYFDDVYNLASYSSYDQAVSMVEKNLASNTVGVRQLYRIDIPGKDQTIIGVSMHAPAGGDKHMDDTFQMDTVDFKPLKQTAYLPYEIMINGDKVIALHMRFRMAVYFPDLRMMGSHSFMDLMASPEAIRKALTTAVGGTP